MYGYRSARIRTSAKSEYGLEIHFSKAMESAILMAIGDLVSEKIFGPLDLVTFWSKNAAIKEKLLKS
ncbi:MAG: hypothetical protein K6C08_09015 [Oscillospiraceae bacterium]|nr:hypothetical protein [Oscillospiraceae bacterium]